MADIRRGHTCNSLEGLFHGRLAVGAHHTLDFHCLSHEILLSQRFQRFLLLLFIPLFLPAGVVGQKLPVRVKRQRMPGAVFPVFCILCGAVHLHEVQAERIGDHTEARQAHGERAEHGIHGDAQGDEESRGDGDEDRIVDERPEKAPQDGLVGLPAKAHGSTDICQPALH